jgi:hypothetical protein
MKNQNRFGTIKIYIVAYSAIFFGARVDIFAEFKKIVLVGHLRKTKSFGQFSLEFAS